MIPKNVLKQGDTFYYVSKSYYEDDNGNEHLEFYSMPYYFEKGDDSGNNYDLNRMFLNEQEANDYAVYLTKKEGF